MKPPKLSPEEVDFRARLAAAAQDCKPGETYGSMNEVAKKHDLAYRHPGDPVAVAIEAYRHFTSSAKLENIARLTTAALVYHQAYHRQNGTSLHPQNT